ncbi:MAG: FHA domain-containing protein, partial [Planctomycetota bacterium]
MGRSSKCDITIRDPALSRRHIEVRATGAGVRVTD